MYSKNMETKKTLIRSGKFKLTPGMQTIIPVSVGRGPWCVKQYRALRIIRRFKSDIGMPMCEVEVEPVTP